MSARSYSGWGFLAITLLIFVGLALYDMPTALAAGRHFLKLLRVIAPVLLLVFLLMFVSLLVIRESWIKRFVGERSGWRGWLLASLAGILSVGPIYVWYPLLQTWMAKGMRPGLVATFLYNRAVKIPWLPVMVTFFGWSFTLAITFWMVVFGILEGLLIERILSDRRSTP